jgi:tRNA U34 5-carboxymethylaminomethyl modifying GTPase MnmE/TrmE
VEGFSVFINDTAGLREGVDVGDTERAGIERTMEQLHKADIR